MIRKEKEMRNKEWLAFVNSKKKKKKKTKKKKGLKRCRFGKLMAEINSRLTGDLIGKE